MYRKKYKKYFHIKSKSNLKKSKTNSINFQIKEFEKHFFHFTALIRYWITVAFNAN